MRHLSEVWARAPGAPPSFVLHFHFGRSERLLPRRVMEKQFLDLLSGGKLPPALDVCARCPRTGNLCRLISLILLIKTIYEADSSLLPALFFLSSFDPESRRKLALGNPITRELIGKGRLACLSCLLTVVVAPSASR